MSGDICPREIDFFVPRHLINDALKSTGESAIRTERDVIKEGL